MPESACFGVCKKWNRKQGFGFILTAKGEDLFCHVSAIMDGNALRGIQSFVDRRTRSGAVFGAESECLTPEQAVRAYTEVAARASGQAESKGTLSPGKLADLVVLGASPLEVDPTTIKEIPVRATLLGGEFTHSTL